MSDLKCVQIRASYSGDRNFAPNPAWTFTAIVVLEGLRIRRGRYFGFTEEGTKCPFILDPLCGGQLIWGHEHPCSKINIFEKDMCEGNYFTRSDEEGDEEGEWVYRLDTVIDLLQG